MMTGGKPGMHVMLQKTFSLPCYGLADYSLLKIAGVHGTVIKQVKQITRVRHLIELWKVHGRMTNGRIIMALIWAIFNLVQIPVNIFSSSLKFLSLIIFCWEKAAWTALLKLIFLLQEKTSGIYLHSGHRQVFRISLYTCNQTESLTGISHLPKTVLVSIPVIQINLCLTKKTFNSTGRELTWMQTS